MIINGKNFTSIPYALFLSPTLRPQLPIQHTIIDRLVQMHGFDVFALVQIGDGAGDAEDFVVGPGG
jgi:hypothetical protein